MKIIHSIKQLREWVITRLTPPQLILLLSIIIGFSVGLAAVVIKNSVHFIQKLLTSGFANDFSNYLYFALPAIGIFIVIIFIKYVLHQHVGHGIPSVLYALSKEQGRIRAHNLFSSIITSSLTVGFGGSVGLEGPTVATGAAIGSNIGRIFKLNYRQISLMLAFACTGAMAAIFKAPIAAIVFAIEVIMLDLTLTSLVPLLVCSVTAALTSYAFLGTDVLYTFDLQDKFHVTQVPYYILFGIFAGLISVYFTKMYVAIGSVFDRLKTWYYKFIVGALGLGILLYLFPSLYGEGYDAINSCLRGDYSHLFDKSPFFNFQDNMVAILALFFMIIIFKVIATSFTFGAGGIGGIFAPSLFLGANAGLFFANLSKYFGIDTNIPASSFALVGMAGLISGVIHAPLTAMFLIAEITEGYGLFMPLMIVVTISYATMKIFTKNSVYTVQLAKRGELLTHHKDKNILKMMKIRDLIEDNFSVVKPEMSLGQFVDVVSKSERNLFPVIDSNKKLLGVVFINDVRHIIFKQELYNSYKVRDFMYTPSYIVDINDTMEDVAQKFNDSGNFNLPVLEDGKYVGYVSRANVFSSYRQLLKEFSED